MISDKKVVFLEIFILFFLPEESFLWKGIYCNMLNASFLMVILLWDTK